LNLSVIEFNSVHLFSADFASDHNTTHDTRKSKVQCRRPIQMSDHAASLFTNREPERRFFFHPTKWIHFSQILRKRAFARVTSIGESIGSIFGGKNYAEFSKTRDIFGPCPVVFIQSRKRLSNSESRSKNYDWDAAITILRW